MIRALENQAMSAATLQTQNECSENILKVLNDVSKLLKNKIFSGCYKERRLVETGSVSLYKDVIVINKSEHEFLKTLRSANALLQAQLGSQILTCISGTGTNYSLWTNLSDIAFGSHFFLIKNIIVNQNIVHFRVKWLRSVNAEHELSSLESDFDWNNFKINPDSLKNVLRNLSEVVTMDNTIHFFKLLMVLFLTALIGSYKILLLLVGLVKELNYFIRTIMPFLIVCVESMTKAFGGFLILIAMMWRNKGNTRNIFNSPTTPMPAKYLTYPRPSGTNYSSYNVRENPYIQNRSVPKTHYPQHFQFRSH